MTEQFTTAAPIFLVTVMKPVDWDKVPDKHMRRDRTWGWFFKFEDAERAVLANATDMFEANYYNYAVIEEVAEGLTWPAKIRGWYYAAYEADDAMNPKVSKIDEPAWAERIVNWGIG